MRTKKILKVAVDQTVKYIKKFIQIYLFIQICLPYGEGRRGFKPIKFYKHFHKDNHNGTHSDLIVHIIDCCEPTTRNKGNLFENIILILCDQKILIM